MKIVDEIKREERARKRYDGAVTLADEIFGRERVLAQKRDFNSSDPYDTIYVDKVEEGGIIQYGIEICVRKPEIKVYNESTFSEARRFGERLERAFEEEITLRHNYMR